MPTITDRIDAKVLGDGSLKVIANYGAGFEHIDLDAAKAAGIVVSNTPGALTEATADIALTLILMAARRAGEGERELRAGRWTGWRPTHLLGQTLAGKTLGLVGFGRIAQATARRAREGFGMKITYHGRRRAEAEVEARFDAQYHADLGELLAACDVVSLHCPGGPATRHLINAERLGQMKPTAILINTARGSVVDEAALAQALETRRIAAAGLDVYEAEPAIHPALLALENAVLLPHLGSATIESRTSMGMQAADNLDAFFAGQEPADRIA
jgi:lactate dehydrogenase-like 2-hydroxyacid dehydrogenase